MTAHGRSLALGVGMVLASLVSIQLYAQAEPAAGMWMLNVAKSKYSPGPAPKSQMLTIAVAGQGVHITTESVGADGTKATTDYTANFDGKEVPIKGAANTDTVSLKRVNANTVERTDRKCGKVTVTITRVLSADGKTLTVTTKGMNEKGQTVNNVAVYEKH